MSIPEARRVYFLPLNEPLLPAKSTTAGRTVRNIPTLTFERREFIPKDSKVNPDSNYWMSIVIGFIVLLQI